MKLNKFLLIFTVLINPLFLQFVHKTDDQNYKNQLSSFETQKSILQDKLNSNHLNNYLRKILLKVPILLKYQNNNISDESFVFIDEKDFDFKPQEIYFNIIPKSEIPIIQEMKSRLFTLKWVYKINQHIHYNII